MKTLSSLKIPQLQRLAQATGIRESRPKDLLIRRLENGLKQNQFQDKSQCSWNLFPRFGPGENGDCRGKGRQGGDLRSLPTSLRKDTNRKKNHEENGMSILSIDMGIRNLGIAHLIVPGIEGANDNKNVNTEDNPPSRLRMTPMLNAWHRLNISSLHLQLPEESEEGGIGTSLSDTPTTLEEASNQTKTKKPTKGTLPPFSKSLYASHAYTLITSLLETYKPTHVLIERQRFRSGGRHEVLEWSLRVGLLEAMFYTVLHTLRGEMLLDLDSSRSVGNHLKKRGRSADTDASDKNSDRLLLRKQTHLQPPPFVYGMDPQRVVRYWEETTGFEPVAMEAGAKGDDIATMQIDGTLSTPTSTSTSFGTKKKPRKTSEKESLQRKVKKGKIDLVGRWLLAGREDNNTTNSSEGENTTYPSSTERPKPDPNVDNSSPKKLQISQEDPELMALVDAYIRKWQNAAKGKRTRNKTSTPKDRDPSGSDGNVKCMELDKLDDLADCLLQGVTWLDWQVMRHRILEEGIGVVLSESR